MADWAVSIYVALVGAAASLLVAYLGARKDRNDERGRILQDLEIAKELAKTDAIMLRVYVGVRVRRMVVEDKLAEHSRSQFAGQIASLMITGSIVWVVLQQHWSDWPMIPAVLFLIVVALLTARTWRRQRRKIIDDNSSVWEQAMANLAREAETPAPPQSPST